MKIMIPPYPTKSNRHYCRFWGLYEWFSTIDFRKGTRQNLNPENRGEIVEKIFIVNNTWIFYWFRKPWKWCLKYNLLLLISIYFHVLCFGVVSILSTLGKKLISDKCFLLKKAKLLRNTARKNKKYQRK